MRGGRPAVLASLLIVLAAPLRAQEGPGPTGEREAAPAPMGREALAPPLADAGGSHLYLAPTGRTHPQGTRTAGLFAYLFPFAGYAVTDDLHLGGGIPLFSFWERELVVYVTPKLRVLDAEELDVAIGALSWLSARVGAGAAPTVEPGVFYGTATWERAPLALTGGLARGFRSLGGPTFAFGGIEASVLDGARQGDDGIELMAEIFGFPVDDDYFFDGASMGAATLRFYDPSVAFDVGMIWYREAGRARIAPFPLVGVSVVF